MANRFEEEFPEMDLKLVPPPIGPDGLQQDISPDHTMARADQLFEAREVGVAWWTWVARAVASARTADRRHPPLTAGSH